MERDIRLRTRGQIQEMGPSMLIRAALPNQEIEYISPFILLHHIQPALVEKGWTHVGVPSHPHKGFITFTYMLDGEFQHRDSAGGQGLITSGGAQWMMTGSGIVHEEMIGREFAARGGNLEMLQLWINIPSRYKAADPYYRILGSGDMPIVHSADAQSWLQVLAGNYQGAASPIELLSPLQILRIHLGPSGYLEIKDIPDSYNMFGYITTGEISIGPKQTIVNDGETILFTHPGTRLNLKNPGPGPADIFLFGAEPIGEPMAASGPFVMNSQEEIREAYREYQLGKYGRLTSL